MKRVLLCVAYDGTNYSGWQFQENAETIEGELNKALSDLHEETITVIGASRTDAGVHALANMAVYDTNARMPGEKVSYALNVRLPRDIRIVWSKEVAEDFHPRHMLTEKTYEYHIWNDDFMPPTNRLYFYRVPKKLNLDAMREAAKYLPGEKDFKSFCSVNTTAETTVRNLISVEIIDNMPEVTIRVTGNGFLYNMVRIIAGTLVDVGLGRRTTESVDAALKACDRQKAGPTAPANALFLKDFKFVEIKP